MWDENPAYQESIYRFLVGSVVVALVADLLISLISGDWDIFFAFLRALGVVVAALCLYAGFIWSIGNLVLLTMRLFRKLRNSPEPK